MNTIGVVGAGRMGSGIAQVAAQSGFEVILYDISGDMLQVALENIKKHLQRAVEVGDLEKENINEVLTRIHPTTKLKHFITADLIIEAVVEDIDVKMKIFKELDDRCELDTILATNTSSMSVTRIASATENPHRVIGTHFFNPPYILKLVEVVKAHHTSDEIISRTVDFVKKLGKNPIIVRDSPGFIVNRIARHFFLEPLRSYEMGIAQIDEIDSGFKLFGFELGPFEVMDYVGNDVNYIVSRSIFEQFNYAERFRPVIFQAKMVEAGLLGRKTHAGFYNYVGDRKEVQEFLKKERIKYDFGRKFLKLADLICRKLMRGKGKLKDNQKLIIALTISSIVNEAHFALMEGLASREDIDTALKLGAKFPAGPFEWSKRVGIKRIFEFLTHAQLELSTDRYRPSLLLKKISEG
jgi:3-hydroxybutyryl-CoA dehydrogenase